MIPVLHGVWASGAAIVSEFEHIETQTVGAGGAASIAFTSIPGTYRHLQLRGISRSTRSSTNDDILIRFNSDSGSNYAWHYLLGDGATASSGGGTSQTSGLFTTTAAANATASIFGAAVVDILGYASTSKNKTVRTLGGNDRNGSGALFYTSALWMNSSTAITSITILPGTGPNFAQYSSFSLYGVK